MPSTILVIAAVVGIATNTIAIVMIAWRGGMLIGKMMETQQTLVSEVQSLRDSRHEHNSLLQRLTAWLEFVAPTLTPKQPQPQPREDAA